jgi:hypothetical protein
MLQVRFDGRFDGWREAARDLLHRGIAPHHVEWLAGDEAGGLFGGHVAPEPIEPS